MSSALVEHVGVWRDDQGAEAQNAVARTELRPHDEYDARVGESEDPWPDLDELGAKAASPAGWGKMSWGFCRLGVLVVCPGLVLQSAPPWPGAGSVRATATEESPCPCRS
uniref:Uncharacterized protein n=1 Tax=Phytophthora ramorum TaxID=164328 RepID=H3H6G8_PHYRM